MNKSIFLVWLKTARPKTLPLALASILVGAALALSVGSFDIITTTLALITTLLLQILSNFANDYGDHIKGSDTSERIGPLRGIQQGEITKEQLKNAVYILIGLSLFSGLTLIIYAYQSLQDIIAFSVLGILAIICAITYTVGKKPYGYIGLGDISVLIFFGFLAVLGTFYLQAHYLPFVVFFPAFSCGLLSVAVLNINNLRDINQDRLVGKNTLVVRIGSKNGRIYHFILLTLAIVFYLFFSILTAQSWSGFLFLITLPLLIKHTLKVHRHQDPNELRPLLGQMAGIALITNLMFSIGIMV